MNVRVVKNSGVVIVNIDTNMFLGGYLVFIKFYCMC